MLLLLNNRRASLDSQPPLLSQQPRYLAVLVAITQLLQVARILLQTLLVDSANPLLLRPLSLLLAATCLEEVRSVSRHNRSNHNNQAMHLAGLVNSSNNNLSNLSKPVVCLAAACSELSHSNQSHLADLVRFARLLLDVSHLQ